MNQTQNQIRSPLFGTVYIVIYYHSVSLSLKL